MWYGSVSAKSLPTKCRGRERRRIEKNAIALLAKSGNLCYNFPNRRIDPVALIGELEAWVSRYDLKGDFFV
jgi:hypothetical protein